MAMIRQYDACMMNVCMLILYFLFNFISNFHGFVDVLCDVIVENDMDVALLNEKLTYVDGE